MNENQIEVNLKKIQVLHNKNISRVRQKFTGKVLVHWKEGEPMKEEETNFSEIKTDI